MSIFNKLLATLSSTWKKATEKPVVSIFYGLAVILVLAPCVIMLSMLLLKGVNTLWWDHMPFAELMFKLRHGKLGLYDLWRQHNEHRILTAYISQLLVGLFTGFNFKILILLSWVTALGSLLILGVLQSITIRSKEIRLVLFIFTSWLIFSAAQWINWVWAFQLVFFQGVLFALLTFYILTKSEGKIGVKPLLISILTAVAATYCIGNGIIVWVVGLAIVWIRKENRKVLIAWVASGSLILTTYFYNFERSSESLPLIEVVKEPIAVIKYVLTYLGKNLTTTPQSAQNAGIVLVIIFVLSILLIYKKKKISRILPWIAIATYVLGTATLAAVSRLNFGVYHAFVSNSYPTISLLFIVALISLVAYLLEIYIYTFRKKHLIKLVGCVLLIGLLLGVAASGYVTNYKAGISSINDLSNHQKKVLSCIYSVRSENDPCLDIVYPIRADAWRYREYLRRLDWDGFKKQ